MEDQMFCPTCGAQIAADSVTCPECGAATRFNEEDGAAYTKIMEPIADNEILNPATGIKAEESSEQVKIEPEGPAGAAAPAVAVPAANTPSAVAMSKSSIYEIVNTVLSAIGVIAGVISIFWGLAIGGSDTGLYESNSYYGGDAYTGIQNAAAQAANNVIDANTILADGFCALLVVFGIALIAYFLPKALLILKKL